MGRSRGHVALEHNGPLNRSRGATLQKPGQKPGEVPKATSKIEANHSDKKTREKEVATLELQKRMAAKLEQLNRLKFEVMNMRKEIAQDESSIFERANKVVAVGMQTSQEAKTAVYLQKAIRRWLLYRKYKGKDALLLPLVDQYRKSEASERERTRWKFIKEIYSSQVSYVGSLDIVVQV